MRQPPDALVVMSDAAIYDLRADISNLLLQHRLPSIAYVQEFTEAGTLMSYGPPRAAMYRRAADYLKKILDGARPADLPVEQPVHVELWINLKTARLSGSPFPTSSWRAPTGCSSEAGAWRASMRRPSSSGRTPPSRYSAGPSRLPQRPTARAV
jgi:ABC-type uncharacterized transport system substrate-binding protein